MPWIERLDLTVDPAPAPRAMQEHMHMEGGDDDQVHNDFKREMKLCETFSVSADQTFAA